MDMYPSGIKPVESTKHSTSPTANFDDDHTWLVTRIDFIYLFHVSESHHEDISPDAEFSGGGLILPDTADPLIFEGLKRLVRREDNLWVGTKEGYHGLNQIIPQVFQIIAYNWSIFIAEAEEHLDQIVISNL